MTNCKKLFGISVALLTCLLLAGCFGFSNSSSSRLVGTVTIDIEDIVPAFDDDVDVDVSGDVDTEKRLGIEGAEVKLRDKTYTTGASGAFNFPNLEKGDYDLVVTYLGEELYSETIVIGSNATETRNIVLTPDDLDMTESDILTTFGPALPIALDLGLLLHQRVMKKAYDYLDVEIKNDPFGDPAVYFPQGKAGQAAPVSGIRFVLLETDDVDEFSFSVKSLGDGNLPGAIGPGNNTFTLIFGYEDIDNFWVANYSLASGSTGIHRVKDGVLQTHKCRPNQAGWSADNDQYQTIEITLTRDGDKMIYNDMFHKTSGSAPTPFNNCELDGNDYVPGKIGIGGHGTSVNMAWYYKDVTLEKL